MGNVSRRDLRGAVCRVSVYGAVGCRFFSLSYKSDIFAFITANVTREMMLSINNHLQTVILFKIEFAVLFPTDASSRRSLSMTNKLPK